MIPTKLNLVNFGPVEGAEIDLSGIDLAAVVGQNGTGKSTTCTIAPLWALFGGTKNGCSPDDLVRMGATDASVTLEFEHHGELYRVVRTRSTAGRGKSSLELQLRSGEEWTSLSGSTIRETEEKIRALLGLDEETLVASSMILQGRANEFTAKPAGQRKAILGQILGLEVYDRLQEGARKHVQEATAQLDQTSRRLNDIGSALGVRGGIEEQVAATEAEIYGATVEIERSKEALTHEENRFSEAKVSRVRMEELEKRHRTVLLKIDELAGKISRLEEEEKRAKDLLAKEPEVEAKILELDGALEAIRALEPKRARHEALQVEYRMKSKELETLRSEMAANRARIDALRKELTNAAEMRAAAEEFEKLKALVDEKWTVWHEVMNLEKSAEHLDDELLERKHALAMKRSVAETAIAACRDKIAIMDNSRCVDLAKATASPCAFLLDAIEAKRKMAEFEQHLAGLDDPRILELEAEIAPILARAKELSETLKGFDELKLRLAEMEPMAEKAAGLDSKMEMLEVLEGNIASSMEREKNLTNLVQEIITEGRLISSELEQLPQLKSIEAQGPAWRALQKDIADAKVRKAVLEEQGLPILAESEAALNEDKELAAAIVKERRGPNPDDIAASIAELKRVIDSIQTQINALRERRGSLTAKLEELDRLAIEEAEITKRRSVIGKTRAVYSDLVRAFGKDGIPALIIENAVPELERISNEILSDMSQGRHSLRFETQRELKSRAGMAETLDIIVADWAGARPYETFSGGEQLRIDYAIRFALAELLARRAGNRIEWLVIDEGLGSQDREHRELVLEAIRNVAGRFRRVFVITHVEEAQEAFPQQIRFDRTPRGVEVTVR